MTQVVIGSSSISSSSKVGPRGKDSASSHPPGGTFLYKALPCSLWNPLGTALPFRVFLQHHSRHYGCFWFKIILYLRSWGQYQLMSGSKLVIISQTELGPKSQWSLLSGAFATHSPGLCHTQGCCAELGHASTLASNRAFIKVAISFVYPVFRTVSN